MPVHSSGIVSEGQPTFRLYAARIASRLARDAAPSNPEQPKGRESGKRVKPVRTAVVIVRVCPEERDTMRLNVGVYGLSMADYVRQTCLGILLRKTLEKKQRLRELARIGVNLNQIARWVNAHSDSLSSLTY